MYYKMKEICEGASRSDPDPKNSTTPPVLKSLDPPLLNFQKPKKKSKKQNIKLLKKNT